MNPTLAFTRRFPRLGTAIAFGLLATAHAQEPPHGSPPEKMKVERTDGRSFEAKVMERITLPFLEESVRMGTR